MVFGNKLLMCLADRGVWGGGGHREMGIYEASHPITHHNILSHKYPPHRPPMTNCPAHSGQLCLCVKMGEKALLLMGSNLQRHYCYKKNHQFNAKYPHFIPSRLRLFEPLQNLIKDLDSYPSL